MRRTSTTLPIALGLLTLATLITAYHWTRSVHAMNLRFNVKDLQGLKIISPLDPSFDGLVVSHFKGDAKPGLEELKPFSVFVKNTSAQSVVAYVLKWELVRTDGRTITNFTAYAQPGVLMGNVSAGSTQAEAGHIIKPDSMRLFSWDSPLDPGHDSSIGVRAGGSANPPPNEIGVKSKEAASKVLSELKSQLTQATSITVSIDGAFFEDGTFVGANSSGYFEQIKAQVDARMDLLEEVASALAQQADIDKVLDSIASRTYVSIRPAYLESKPEDLYSFYAGLFAREIASLRSTYGSQRAAAYLADQQARQRPTLKKAKL